MLAVITAAGSFSLTGNTDRRALCRARCFIPIAECSDTCHEYMTGVFTTFSNAVKTPCWTFALRTMAAEGVADKLLWIG